MLPMVAHQALTGPSPAVDLLAISRPPSLNGQTGTTGRLLPVPFWRYLGRPVCGFRLACFPSGLRAFACPRTHLGRKDSGPQWTPSTRRTLFMEKEKSLRDNSLQLRVNI